MGFSTILSYLIYWKHNRWLKQTRKKILINFQPFGAWWYLQLTQQFGIIQGGFFSHSPTPAHSPHLEWRSFLQSSKSIKLIGLVSYHWMYYCIRKEGRIHGWEDNRHALFTIYLNMFNSELVRQHTKPPLAATISPFMSPWREWCVKVVHSGVGSFKSHKNQISERAVRRDLRFFRPYPRRLDSLNVCGCHYRGSTFFWII